MKKIAILLTVCAMIAGCKQKPTTATFDGVVLDATMHTMLLAVNDTTVWISTDDATDLSKCSGILVGQSVKADCKIVPSPTGDSYTAINITAPDKPYKDYIVGSWVEPNPIAPDQVQGFTLKEDGTAESINMATLLYKAWSIDGNKLTLTAESIGNGQSETSNISFTITAISKTTLIITADGEGENQPVFTYSRQ